MQLSGGFFVLVASWELFSEGFRLLLAGTSNTRIVLKHTLYLLFSSNRNISSHLSSQCYNITRRTYQNIPHTVAFWVFVCFFAVSVQNPSNLFLRNSSKAIEPWISETTSSYREAVLTDYMQLHYYLYSSRTPPACLDEPPVATRR